MPQGFSIESESEITIYFSLKGPYTHSHTHTHTHTHTDVSFLFFAVHTSDELQLISQTYSPQINPL